MKVSRVGGDVILLEQWEHWPLPLQTPSGSTTLQDSLEAARLSGQARGQCLPGVRVEGGTSHEGMTSGDGGNGLCLGCGNVYKTLRTCRNPHNCTMERWVPPCKFKSTNGTRTHPPIPPHGNHCPDAFRWWLCSADATLDSLVGAFRTAVAGADPRPRSLPWSAARRGQTRWEAGQVSAGNRQVGWLLGLPRESLERCVPTCTFKNWHLIFSISFNSC